MTKLPRPSGRVSSSTMSPKKIFSGSVRSPSMSKAWKRLSSKSTSPSSTTNSSPTSSIKPSIRSSSSDLPLGSSFCGGGGPARFSASAKTSTATGAPSPKRGARATTWRLVFSSIEKGSSSPPSSSKKRVSPSIHSAIGPANSTNSPSKATRLPMMLLVLCDGGRLGLINCKRRATGSNEPELASGGPGVTLTG